MLVYQRVGKNMKYPTSPIFETHMLIYVNTHYKIGVKQALKIGVEQALKGG